MSLEPDPFALSLWAIYDAEKEARRNRPAGRCDTPAGTQRADGEAVVISNPVAYAASALSRAVAELSAVGADRPDEGAGRNAALNNAAMALGHLVGAEMLDAQEVEDALLGACEANGLQQWTGTYACINTIRSGMTAGQRDPLQWVQGEPPAPPNPDDPFDTGLPTSTVATAGDAPPPDRAAILLASEIATQRARREARRLLDAEEAAAQFRVPPSRLSLVDELALPVEPVIYAIDDLLPAGGNALLTAEYKAGKTSTVNDLIRAFCDGTPFLGRYTVNGAPGRIAVFNYEVGDEQYRAWLRDLGIVNLDRACVLNLRGFRVPVTTPSVEDWVVRWLQERQVSFWIVDPFARAFTGCGDNENDNSQVGWFLDALDVIKARAGVRDLVLPTHTGREKFEAGQERSRGATRLEDWCDVRWILTKGETPEDGGQSQRFFSATGRGVDILEGALAWDETDRSLNHTGGDRKHVARRLKEQTVLDFINDNPGTAKRAILTGCGDNKGTLAAVDSLVGCGAVAVQKAEKRGLSDSYTARRTTVEAPVMDAFAFPESAA